MQGIKRVWIMLSSDVVRACNEPPAAGPVEPATMSLETLGRLTEMIRARSWEGVVLADRNGISAEQWPLLTALQAQILLPVEAAAHGTYDRCTLVMERDAMERGVALRRPFPVILRVRRPDLCALADMVTTLLTRVQDVAWRHPDTLAYGDDDLTCYREQLTKIAEWLLAKGESWRQYRIARLTDGLCPPCPEEKECGAGMESVAISPTGDLYPCPAVYLEGGRAAGNISSHLEIPHRHLFGKNYAYACKACVATHCWRCVYLNHRSTGEWCVPPRTVCRLSHVELDVQAWFAARLKETRLWRDDYVTPPHPTVYDPVEYLVDQEQEDTTNLWQRLVASDGEPRKLRPTMMLDIVHSLYGWAKALSICAKHGAVPCGEQIESDILASIRRQVLEPYRDRAAGDNCPTLHEIERLLCRVAQQGVERAR